MQSKGGMMKAVLIILMGLVSIQSKANEIIEIASQINKVTAPICSTDEDIEKQVTIQIGYVRGSAIEAANDPLAGNDYLSLSKEILTKKKFKVITESADYNSWEMLCRKFKNNLKTKNALTKIILVGHSHGAAGALKVANCLNEASIQTDLLISISSYDFMAGVDVTKIPAHVTSHYNIYMNGSETQGYKVHTAINAHVTRIQNIEAKVEQNQLLDNAGHLLQTISMITSAEILGKAASLKLPQSLSSEEVNQNLSSIWNCQPVDALEIAKQSRTQASVESSVDVEKITLNAPENEADMSEEDEDEEVNDESVSLLADRSDD